MRIDFSKLHREPRKPTKVPPSDQLVARSPAYRKALHMSSSSVKSECQLLISDILPVLSAPTGAANTEAGTNLSANGNNCCDGNHVTCNDSSILKLDYRNLNLTGSLPSFAPLISLRYLNLANNSLTGSIADLPALTFLDLSNNQLSGTFGDFLHAPYVKSLRLDGNKLEGQMPKEWETRTFAACNLGTICGDVAPMGCGSIKKCEGIY
jgi:Leucine Rich Repeat